MKILFTIDCQKKEVTFFVKQGHLKDWVLKARRDMPQVTDEEIASRGSQCLAEAVERTIFEIAKKHNLGDMHEYRPNFVYYKRKFELPLKIKRVSS